MRVGLISDTHSLVRPEVFKALAGVELILHAGDVGGAQVLIELRAIAPVHAVYGNTDGPGDPQLAPRIDIVLDGVRVHVSHGHELGSPTPAGLVERYDADVIVYGHTHKPLIERQAGRLVVNPGAAGPKRFKLEPSVALLDVQAGKADVTLVPLL